MSKSVPQDLKNRNAMVDLKKRSGREAKNSGQNKDTPQSTHQTKPQDKDSASSDPYSETNITKPQADTSVE